MFKREKGGRKREPASRPWWEALTHGQRVEVGAHILTSVSGTRLVPPQGSSNPGRLMARPQPLLQACFSIQTSGDCQIEGKEHVD